MRGISNFSVKTALPADAFSLRNEWLSVIPAQHANATFAQSSLRLQGKSAQI
jgi:hypothetical protein